MTPHHNPMSNDAAALLALMKDETEMDMADVGETMGWGRVRVECAFKQLIRRGLVRRQPRYRITMDGEKYRSRGCH